MKKGEYFLITYSDYEQCDHLGFFQSLKDFNMIDFCKENLIADEDQLCDSLSKLGYANSYNLLDHATHLTFREVICGEERPSPYKVKYLTVFTDEPGFTKTYEGPRIWTHEDPPPDDWVKNYEGKIADTL